MNVRAAWVEERGSVSPIGVGASNAGVPEPSVAAPAPRLSLRGSPSPSLRRHRED